jgi:hypothetical protein
MSDIQLYGKQMKEIKDRVDFLNKFMASSDQFPFPIKIETAGLQLRKIFELIAFASLSANRDRYATVYTDFSKHWEAAKLVKNLKNVNQNYYPEPVIEVPIDHPIAKHKLEKRDGDSLTEEELVEAHGRCGALMHASNPYKKAINYEYYKTMIPKWLARTMHLLNNHTIHLVNDPGMWQVHMHEHGHNEVKWYRFQPPTQEQLKTALKNQG